MSTTSSDYPEYLLEMTRFDEALSKIGRTIAERDLRRHPRLKSVVDVDDVLQDVRLKFFRSLQRNAFPEVSEWQDESYRRFASHIIHHHIIDLYRSYLRKRGASGARVYLESEIPIYDWDYEDGDNALPTRAFEDWSGRHESPQRLMEWTNFHDVVSQLPDDVREVFDLIFYQGMTHDEAANVLGISTKTLYRRWSLARHMLARRLNPEDTK